MAYVDLDLPPGIVAIGTDRQSKGYWRDANLIRFPLQPIGGWREKTSTMTGSARAILAWRDNSSNRWAGVGTHSKLYAMNTAGSLYDITPSAFTSGRADATNSSGYGSGLYGSGIYGASALDTSTILPATVHTLDNFGQYLVGCSEEDGRLYEWQLDTGTAAAVISNAPTGCNGCVVTAELFLVAIKDRQILWSDQAVNTTWTAAATNQAGDIDLQTPGTFMCGRRVSGATLIFSDVDVWAMTYVGGVAVFGFQRVGSDCGTMAKGSPIALEGGCVWWGKGGFFRYQGGSIVQIPCDIYEQTIADLNEYQCSKVTSWLNPEHTEVWWHYPSRNSSECDRAVAWNYETGKWTPHTLARTCGVGAGGVFLYPLLVGTDGKVYEHEVDYDRDDVNPSVRSAPYELGSGDQVMMVTGVVGDEKTTGEAQVTFHASDYPGGTVTEYGPYALSSAPNHAPRFTARQVEVEIEFTDPADSRVGVIRLEMKPRGRR